MTTKTKLPDDLKEAVRIRYNRISQQSTTYNTGSCCGSGPASQEVYNIMTDDYRSVDGYNREADLGLGCGLPTQFARIREGNTVVDLGSGAGNDCFVARHEAGPTGKVIGIDFAEAMIEKARNNADKLGLNNVEFRYGDIENLPLPDNMADVIVSNCVLNLVPDKRNVFSEIYRVLKPGGHFSISDIVLVGDLPEALREDVEMYAGCVSGAIQKDEYLAHVRDLGFEQLTIQKEKPIEIPDDILERYLERDEIDRFYSDGAGIFSITVFASKPGRESIEPGPEEKPLPNSKAKACCAPGSGCC